MCPSRSLSVEQVAVAIANATPSFWIPTATTERAPIRTCGDVSEDGRLTSLQTYLQVDGALAAQLVIECLPNNKLVKCVENDAINSGILPSWAIHEVFKLHSTPLRLGHETTLRLETQLDGQLSVTLMQERQMANDVDYSTLARFQQVLLSSLTRIAMLMDEPTIYRVTLDGGSEHVFKHIPHDELRDGPCFPFDFYASIPAGDALVPPTHVVVDAEKRFWGILMDYHPASSLRNTLQRMTETIPWGVKLAWACDISAALAWLHDHNVIWGDLKTENVLVCSDGRCRLIDYSPGGYTVGWTPPGADPWDFTIVNDVFALGLILWVLATGESVLPWGPEAADISSLTWSDDIPRAYKELVVAMCFESPRDAADVHAALATLEP
uniref:Serine/threonine protein kinase n=1 Tax=Mycena chlorophos TaxID=658473 RepID=A0ABQ0LC81_MYCCL|nr:serine/threonine protein kinase [Mycena chlorophos]